MTTKMSILQNWLGLYPAQKHIYLKIFNDTVVNHELSKPAIFSQNGHPVNSNFEIIYGCFKFQ